MERLTERDHKGRACIDLDSEDVIVTNYVVRGFAIDRLADYEDAEEQGLLIRLPCKLGTTVFRLQYVDNKEMPGFFKVGIVETKFSIYLLSEYGETVFLTCEEAEAALKEQSNDKSR